MKVILALLRSQNDLDHIIPILWKSKSFFKIIVINTNLQESYLNDPRIKYLNEYIYKDLINFFPSTFKVKVLSYLILINEDKLPRIFRIILNMTKNYIINSLYEEISNIKYKKLSQIIGIGRAPDIIITDYTNQKKIIDLVNKIKASNTKIIFAPHAIDNWKNNHIDETNLDPYFKPPNLLKEFEINLILCPSKNDLNRLRFNMGITNQKTEILGSPRFCNEWRKELENIYLDEINYLKKKFLGKNIITIFLTKKKHNIFQEEVFRTITYLSHMKNSLILVKPHTRGHTEYKKSFEKRDNIEIVDKFNSFALQKISDIVIFSATSVIIDSIIDEKPVFFLRRTVFNKLIFDDYFSSIGNDCREEIFKNVELFFKLKKTNLKKNEIKSFLKDIVHPKKKEVLDLYLKSLKKISN